MVTQKDIAKHLKCPPSTVSAALNNYYGSNGISEKRREQIKKTAKRMGYVVDDIARSVKTGKSKTIAFVADNWLTLYNATLVAERRSYHIAPISIKNNNLLKILKAKRIQAVLFHKADCAGQIQQLTENGIFCGCTSEYMPMAHVNIFTDCATGGRLAASSFIEAGHKNFSVIGSLNENVSNVRIEAFSNKLKEHGFQLDDRFKIMTRNDNTIYDDIDRFFKENSKLMPTAFFCTKKSLSDYLCIICGRYSFRFPEDFKIITYTNSLYNLPVYKIKEKRTEITELAINKLIDFVDGKRKNKFHKKYGVELVNCGKLNQPL